MTYFTERQRFTAWWLWILDPDGFMAGVAEARRHSGGGRAARGGRAPGSG